MIHSMEQQQQRRRRRRRHDLLQSILPLLFQQFIFVSCILLQPTLTTYTLKESDAFQIPLHVTHTIDKIQIGNWRRRRIMDHINNDEIIESKFHIKQNRKILNPLMAKRIPRTSLVIAVDESLNTTTTTIMVNDDNTTTNTTSSNTTNTLRIQQSSLVSDNNNNVSITMTNRRVRQRTTTPISRAPHQYDHRTELPRPFIHDVKLELQKYTQPFNTNTTTTEPFLTFDLQLALQNSNTNNSTVSSYTGNIIPNHYQYYSLQELFPTLINLSIWFHTNISFRNDLRSAIRNDIFYSTGTYQNMSLHAQTILLLPDSSIQGNWKCYNNDRTNSTSSSSSTSNIRMIQLTVMLQKYFGTDCINGDVFMETIGALCNSDYHDDDTDTDMTTTTINQPKNHWIDIVGIKNRRVTHSWHQDTGRSHINMKDTSTNNHHKKKTVLWGFPCEDDYDGIGVFSHIIPLQQEQIATDTHPINVPIVYDDILFSNHNNNHKNNNNSRGMEDYIVRPTYRRGQEILVYSDTDVLHSAPDIAYRTSCMRFM